VARFVRLSNRWVNLDLVGSADDEGESIRLNADLGQGTGRISRVYGGEDAETLRAALNALVVNAAAGEGQATEGAQDAATEDFLDRG